MPLHAEGEALGARQLDALDDAVGSPGHRATIPAMVKRIYADVPEKLHAMAAQSVKSHLVKLAREDRVREHPAPDAPSRWELLGGGAARP